MKPIIAAGNFRFYVSPLLLLICFLIATLVLCFGNKKTSFRQQCYKLLCIGVFAMIGGRILNLLATWNQCPIRLDTLVSYGGGIAGQGSLLGGTLGLLLFARDTKKPFLQEADSLVFVLPILYMVLRIKCYFVGCCWGSHVEGLPWGVVFPHSDLHKSFIVRHPVQLYESFGNFLILLFLIEYKKATARRFEGQLFLLFLILNSIGRFVTDYFRWGVSAQVMWGVITQAQIASLVIIAGSLVAWRVLSKQPVVSGQLSVAS